MRRPPKDEAGDVKPITQRVTRVERDLEKLTGQLDQIMRKRETLKKQMNGVVWRAELATEHSEQVNECAWDRRLCFGDEDAVAVDGKWWCWGKGSVSVIQGESPVEEPTLLC